MDTNTKTAETAKYSTANDNTFASEVLNSDQPVLVDFWANWCGPCRMIAPVVEGLAAQYEGKARVVKVDVDENPALCEQYGIRSIPALLIFKNGEVVDRVVGVVSRTVLTEKLNAQLWRPAAKTLDGAGSGGNFTG